jgi:methionine-rich copper-binding protein CopC
VDELDADLSELPATMKRLPQVIVFSFAAWAALAMPRIAAAHAFPRSETPAAGATVNPPPRVIIDFDAPVERLFAKLQVIDGAGNDVAAQPPVIDAEKNEMSAAMPSLKAGDYMVKWSVVSNDGHRTEGSYTFTVASNPK